MPATGPTTPRRRIRRERRATGGHGLVEAHCVWSLRRKWLLGPLFPRFKPIRRTDYRDVVSDIAGRRAPEASAMTSGAPNPVMVCRRLITLAGLTPNRRAVARTPPPCARAARM